MPLDPTLHVEDLRTWRRTMPVVSRYTVGPAGTVEAVTALHLGPDGSRLKSPVLLHDLRVAPVPATRCSS